MKALKFLTSSCWQLATLLFWLATTTLSRGEIIGPYVPDADTLHLWHLNELRVPAVDAVKNGTDLLALGGGAALGNNSFNVGKKHFGTAVRTYTGNPKLPPEGFAEPCYLSARTLASNRSDNVSMSYAGANNAFTYEAIVRIDFDPALNFSSMNWKDKPGKNVFLYIIDGDADEAEERVFIFRLAPIGALNRNRSPLLEFINLNKNSGIQSLTATIPTSDLDAIRAGAWYHAAVTYNGHPSQPDNVHFYWTLLDASRTYANLIGYGTMTNNLPEGCSPDFTIGQHGRQSSMSPVPNGNFVGLIDEVRLSGVARSASEMMFGP